MEEPAVSEVCLVVPWEKVVDDFDIRKEDMNKLVMNFLSRECYVEVAEKFIQETGNNFEGINLEEVRVRADIKRKILSGQAYNAMYSIRKDKHQIACDPKVILRLAKQIMIEFVRVGKVKHALDFSQWFYPNYVAKYPHRLEEFERIFALLAYEDPFNCPLGELMGMSYRWMTAKLVNYRILSREGYKEACSLDYMLKMMLLDQDDLTGDGSEYPTMNLTTRTYDDPVD